MLNVFTSQVLIAIAALSLTSLALLRLAKLLRASAH
jgi:hypothetical protein